MLAVDDHPLLALRWVALRWPAPLGALAAPDWLRAPEVAAETDRDEVDAVRALLRHGGFKPAGRSRPCSEYIVRAVAEGRFPVVNPAVDLTNLAVLASRLPISTVDPDRLAGPLRVGIAPPGTKYVFNASGQELDLGGLLALSDADGPCANAVKDAQRAKTTADTTRTLTLVWGTNRMPGASDGAADWFVAGAERLGARVEARG